MFRVKHREGRDGRGVEQREGRGLRVWFSNSKQIFKKKTIIFQGKVSFKKKIMRNGVWRKKTWELFFWKDNWDS